MIISNNLISILLILSILISVIAITNYYTKYEETKIVSGMATIYGKANVSVKSQSSITFVDGWNETWFGSGQRANGTTRNISTAYINDGGFYNGSYCNNSVLGTGTIHVKPMCVYNDGSNNATCVKILSSQNADGWITCSGSCLQTPRTWVKAYNNHTNACHTGLHLSWQDLNTTTSVICEGLNITMTMGIDYRLDLPENTNSGNLSTAITIIGTDYC